MKRAILLIYLLLHFGTTALSAEDQKVRYEPNAAALMFQVTGMPNISVNNFNGGLGFLYYIYERLSVRLVTGMGYEITTKADPLGNGPDSELSSLDISFLPGVRYNFAENSTIEGYVGLEMMISLSQSISSYPNHRITEPESTDYKSLIGGGLFIGAEWFPFENVSIAAEYKIHILSESGYSELKTEANTYTTKLPDKTIFQLGQPSYMIVVSLYVN